MKLKSFLNHYNFSSRRSVINVFCSISNLDSLYDDPYLLFRILNGDSTNNKDLKQIKKLIPKSYLNADIDDWEVVCDENTLYINVYIYYNIDMPFSLENAKSEQPKFEPFIISGRVLNNKLFTKNNLGKEVQR